MASATITTQAKERGTETLSVELLTPEKILFKGEATLTVVPGAEGDLGILPRHSSLVSLLRPGLVIIHTTSGEVKPFFVPAGFLNVSNNACILMVDHAEDFSKLTVADVQEEIREINLSLSSSLSSVEKKFKEQALLVTQEKLRLLTLPHPR